MDDLDDQSMETFISHGAETGAVKDGSADEISLDSGHARQVLNIRETESVNDGLDGTETGSVNEGPADEISLDYGDHARQLLNPRDTDSVHNGFVDEASLAETDSANDGSSGWPCGVMDGRRRRCGDKNVQMFVPGYSVAKSVASGDDPLCAGECVGRQAVFVARTASCGPAAAACAISALMIVKKCGSCCGAMAASGRHAVGAMCDIIGRGNWKGDIHTICSNCHW